MHIAILSLHSCPWAKPGKLHTGGMNIYIRNIASQLSSLGHSLDIFTLAHSAGGDCDSFEPPPNVRLIHLDISDYSLISEDNIGTQLEMITGAIARAGTSYNLIQSHYWFSGLVGNSLSRYWRIPHVTMFHTLGMLKNSAGLGELEPPARIARETSIARDCDLIIASTDREKKELTEVYGATADKVSVVPCGIDQGLFRPVDTLMARKILGLKPMKTVLFVGRLDPLKGLCNVLSAVKIVGRHDFQLLVVGDNRNNCPGDQAEVQASSVLEQDNVIFAGIVPHTKMYLFYNAADFCVIPSYYESFSLTAIESIACGTPVLATAVGEMPDLARFCTSCRIISDNQPAKLASSISSMLDQDKGIVTLARDDLIMKYGWSYITEKVQAEYEKVLSRCRIPDDIPIHCHCK